MRFRPDEVERMTEFERDVEVVGRSFVDGCIQLEYLFLDPMPLPTFSNEDIQSWEEEEGEETVQE